MQLSEDEIFNKMLKIVFIAIEKLFYYTNMNLLVRRADIT